MFASANSKFKNVHGGTFLNRPVDKLRRLQRPKIDGRIHGLRNCIEMVLHLFVLGWRDKI